MTTLRLGDQVIIEHDTWRHGQQSTVLITGVNKDDSGQGKWTIEETGAHGAGQFSLLMERGGRMPHR